MHVSVHTHTHTWKREHEKKVRINVDLTTEKDVIVGLWAKSWNIYFHLWEICRSFFFFFEGAYEWVKATSSATGNTVTELSLRVQKTSTLSSQSPNSGQGGDQQFHIGPFFMLLAAVASFWVGKQLKVQISRGISSVFSFSVSSLHDSGFIQNTMCSPCSDFSSSKCGRDTDARAWALALNGTNTYHRM